MRHRTPHRRPCKAPGTSPNPKLDVLDPPHHFLNSVSPSSVSFLSLSCTGLFSLISITNAGEVFLPCRKEVGLGLTARRACSGLRLADPRWEMSEEGKHATGKGSGVRRRGETCAGAIERDLM
jgi:hypothetical protein